MGGIQDGLLRHGALVSEERRRALSRRSVGKSMRPSFGRKLQAIKNPGCRQPGFVLRCGELGQLDLIRLHALLTLDGNEGNLLAFLQGLETTALDRAEMHKQVRTAFRGNETKTLGIIEPFDRTILTIRHLKLQLINKELARNIRVETGCRE
jgi:hypothetical protein